MTREENLFDILHTTRAMRRLKPDPIPDELIHQILRAAVAAPNGGNRQDWRFLVIKDQDIKRRVQPYYEKALYDIVTPQYRNSEPPPGISRYRYDRQLDAVTYLTKHFHEAPIWIIACLREVENAPTRSSGASIYPAVQNMLLAARALGLGATLTTRHLIYEAEVEEILGLPHGFHSYALIPIGYPMGRFGPVGRGSLNDVVYLDRWGEPYPGLK